MIIETADLLKKEVRPFILLLVPVYLTGFFVDIYKKYIAILFMAWYYRSRPRKGISAPRELLLDMTY